MAEIPSHLALDPSALVLLKSKLPVRRPTASANSGSNPTKPLIKVTGLPPCFTANPPPRRLPALQPSPVEDTSPNAAEPTRRMLNFVDVPSPVEVSDTTWPPGASRRGLGPLPNSVLNRPPTAAPGSTLASPGFHLSDKGETDVSDAPPYFTTRRPPPISEGPASQDRDSLQQPVLPRISPPAAVAGRASPQTHESPLAQLRRTMREAEVSRAQSGGGERHAQHASAMIDPIPTAAAAPRSVAAPVTAPVTALVTAPVTAPITKSPSMPTIEPSPATRRDLPRVPSAPPSSTPSRRTPTAAEVNHAAGAAWEAQSQIDEEAAPAPPPAKPRPSSRQVPSQTPQTRPLPPEEAAPNDDKARAPTAAPHVERTRPPPPAAAAAPTAAIATTAVAASAMAASTMATTDVPDATSAAPGVSSAGKRRAASASSRVSSLSQRMAEKARAVASAAAEQAEKKTAEMAEMKRALAEKADEKTSSGGAKTLTKTQMRAALAAERRAAAEAEGGRRMPARTESGLKGGAPRKPPSPLEPSAPSTFEPPAPAPAAVEYPPPQKPRSASRQSRPPPKPAADAPSAPRHDAELAEHEAPRTASGPPSSRPPSSVNARERRVPSANAIAAPPPPPPLDEVSSDAPTAAPTAAPNRRTPKEGGRRGTRVVAVEPIEAGASPSGVGTHSVCARVGPLGLGLVLDEHNLVLDLVAGGQAATDGVLIIGDELVGVDGEALGHRPLAKVLPRGKKEYTFTVRRDANRPVAVDAAHEAPLAVAAQATSDDSAASGRPPAQRKKAAQRRKPAQRGGGTASEPSAAPPAGGGGGLETWLLQKALEVSMVYRQPIKASATLFERIEQSERLTTFMTELRELSDETKQPLDVVFQCLMQALADSGRAVMVGGAGFDSQGGTFGNPNADDFVPMHQAKVLDRSEALQHADAAIRELAGGRLPWLVDSSDLLRKLLRVKVEDGNDLLMAIDTVNEVHSFWQKLRLHAEQTDEDHFVLYQRLVAF